jgi:HTH-type transcriptional regulator / antitoxin HipB
MQRIRSARDLGATIRGRRQELGLSQSALAAAAAVSRQWLSEVEAGKPTAEFGRVLLVMEALRLDVVPVPRDARPPVGALPVSDLDEVLDEYRRR